MSTYQTMHGTCQQHHCFSTSNNGKTKRKTIYIKTEQNKFYESSSLICISCLQHASCNTWQSRVVHSPQFHNEPSNCSAKVRKMTKKEGPHKFNITTISFNMLYTNYYLKFYSKMPWNCQHVNHAFVTTETLSSINLQSSRSSSQLSIIIIVDSVQCCWLREHVGFAVDQRVECLNSKSTLHLCCVPTASSLVALTTTQRLYVINSSPRKVLEYMHGCYHSTEQKNLDFNLFTWTTHCPASKNYVLLHFIICFP